MTGDDPGERSHVVFTIGHGHDDFGAFAQRCAGQGIRTIVDVRSEPYSSHAPDFTKARLEAICAATGLGYRWLGRTLGGRPSDPELLDAQGRPDPDRVRVAPGFAGGLAEVEGLVATGPLAILCAELDPDRCHRTTLIAPELVALGYRVVHIVADGSTRPYQPPLGW